MPITSSAKKALRQSKTRRERNLRRKKTLNEIIRNYKQLVSVKKMEEATKFLPSVYQAIDKTTKTGLIKVNKASRLKSRLSKKLNAK